MSKDLKEAKELIVDSGRREFQREGIASTKAVKYAFYVDGIARGQWGWNRVSDMVRKRKGDGEGQWLV